MLSSWMSRCALTSSFVFTTIVPAWSDVCSDLKPYQTRLINGELIVKWSANSPFRVISPDFFNPNVFSKVSSGDWKAAEFAYIVRVPSVRENVGGAIVIKHGTRGPNFRDNRNVRLYREKSKRYCEYNLPRRLLRKYLRYGSDYYDAFDAKVNMYEYLRYHLGDYDEPRTIQDFHINYIDQKGNCSRTDDFYFSNTGRSTNRRQFLFDYEKPYRADKTLVAAAFNPAYADIINEHFRGLKDLAVQISPYMLVNGYTCVAFKIRGLTKETTIIVNDLERRRLDGVHYGDMPYNDQSDLR